VDDGALPIDAQGAGPASDPGAAERRFHRHADGLRVTGDDGQ
jgi:hypothetical protein